MRARVSIINESLTNEENNEKITVRDRYFVTTSTSSKEDRHRHFDLNFTPTLCCGVKCSRLGMIALSLSPSLPVALLPSALQKTSTNGLFEKKISGWAGTFIFWAI